ncbi:TlpA family protein disulfide reductase [Candidatus Pandoraea novymonadis]|uniref:Thiol-disulfide oxidoreductase ResA n=1 Tax=Candidatus Pandoraea novymonadis TaxID=1808959 RepID=A0ABX5FFC7_9BURK|nr:TlpA disulfide reductase family protein [Candidatus Pandoraea novymonadis]PSB92369.1 Thiol-disulfide oxidoreductase ResA [Candidatus Pandoraea novymonadis]
MKKKILILVILTLIAGSAGFYFSHSQRVLKIDGDAAVKQLLKIQFPDLNGTNQPISQWHGKILVINFWAPWCSPCVAEMSTLNKLSHEFQDKNVQFIGIGIDSATNILNFLKKVRVDYPLLVAGYIGIDLARTFGNTTSKLPFTAVIDISNNLHTKKIGQISEDELRAILNSLANAIDQAK